MGATTKSDYKVKIARVQQDIERLNFSLAHATTPLSKANLKGQIASKRGEIARLKAEMAKAPKG